MAVRYDKLYESYKKQDQDTFHAPFGSKEVVIYHVNKDISNNKKELFDSPYSVIYILLGMIIIIQLYNISKRGGDEKQQSR